MKDKIKNKEKLMSSFEKLQSKAQISRGREHKKC
jgi:hypothetical protein